MQPARPFFVGGELAYPVEESLTHELRHEGGRDMKYFYVRWKGYDASSDTWEPEASMLEPVQLQQYWDAVASKKSAARTGKRKRSSDDVDSTERAAQLFLRDCL